MGTQFEGRTVIITGAGKGIGRAVALEMAARGAKVIGMSRTQADLDGSIPVSLKRRAEQQGIATRA